MNVSAVQEEINKAADKKLRMAIQDKLAVVRAACGALQREYPGSRIDNPVYPTVTMVREVTPLINGIEQAIMKAKLDVNTFFFDRLEEAMFDAVKDAAREKETDEFMKKVEAAMRDRNYDAFCQADSVKPVEEKP